MMSQVKRFAFATNLAAAGIDCRFENAKSYDDRLDGKQRLAITIEGGEMQRVPFFRDMKDKLPHLQMEINMGNRSTLALSPKFFLQASEQDVDVLFGLIKEFHEYGQKIPQVMRSLSETFGLPQLRNHSAGIGGGPEGSKDNIFLTDNFPVRGYAFDAQIEERLTSAGVTSLRTSMVGDLNFYYHPKNTDKLLEELSGKKIDLTDIFDEARRAAPALDDKWREEYRARDEKASDEFMAKNYPLQGLWYRTKRKVTRALGL